MLSFFVFFTLILSSLHAYLFFKLRHLFATPQMRLALFIFLVSMLALLLVRSREFYAKMPDIVPWVAYTWLGFVLIAFMCFAVVDAGRILLWLGKLASGKDLGFLLAPRVSAPITLIIAVLFAAYGMYEARKPEVKQLTITTAKDLGEAGRVRVVAVSDLHIGETLGARDVAKWVEIIKEQKPDILAVVGDIIDTDMSKRDDESRLLRSVQTTYGAYAVLGNHEVYSGLKNSRDFIRRSGLILLEDTLDSHSPINIAGVNDPNVARFGETPPPDIPALLGSADPARFTLLLKHQPIFQPGEIGLFDLQISGHTHGGQIWPARHLTRRIYGFNQGLTRLQGEAGPSLLYLLNGTGYWGPPMRIGARPDILVFDIVHKGS